MTEITFVTSDGKKLKSNLETMKQCKPVDVFFTENKPDTEMPLPKVPSESLAKIIRFCEQYKSNSLPAIEKPLKSSKLEDIMKDEWLCKFLSAMTIQETNELLIASDYMGLKKLEEFIACGIATKFYGKTVEEIRTEFGITNDFTPEEEKELKQFFDLADDIWS